MTELDKITTAAKELLKMVKTYNLNRNEDKITTLEIAPTIDEEEEYPEIDIFLTDVSDHFTDNLNEIADSVRTDRSLVEFTKDNIKYGFFNY